MTEPQPITVDLLRQLPLPEPEQDTDKNRRGTLLVVGGSACSPGAVMLSGVAAFRAAAGKVLLAVPNNLAVPIAIGFPEAGIHGLPAGSEAVLDVASASDQIARLAQGVDSVLIGPGLADESAAQELTKRLLMQLSGPTLIFDALSLTGLWRHPNLTQPHAGRLVITPHAGEMARLTGATVEQVRTNAQEFAAEAAQRLGCITVLKGARTFIARPDGALYIYEASLPALATSGSGDVLAGLLAGLTARGATVLQSALWAVYLHASAGRVLSDRLGPLGLLARELPAEVPALLRKLAS